MYVTIFFFKAPRHNVQIPVLELFWHQGYVGEFSALNYLLLMLLRPFAVGTSVYCSRLEGALCIF